MIQLLNCFKDLGYQLIFACAATRTNYSSDLSKLGIVEVDISLNDSRFDTYLKELNPNLVLFDRFMTEEQYGWRVAENLPSCLRILNTEDLHSLRSTREQCFKNHKSFSQSDWLAADITKRELASIYRSDLSLIISRFELDLLSNCAGIPEDLLMYLPFLYSHVQVTDTDILPAYEDRHDFVFIGNGKHRPNIDAIKWLHSEIWPLIHSELSDSKLHIYGAYLPESIMALNQPEKGFNVHGWTENSKAALQSARVNLLPLRFGAGLKGKLLEAMICETPSVATEIGLEGIPEQYELKTVCSDNVSEFVGAAISLYMNPSKWQEERNSYGDLLLSEFDRERYFSLLRDRLIQLTTMIGEHRSKNITGNLLLHHTMASTKYLSKWIEAKKGPSS